METKQQTVRQLNLLMQQAVHTCNQLYDYTLANRQVFSGDNEQQLMEVIAGRKPLVDALIELEGSIDALLEQDGACLAEDAGTLPCGGVDGFRRAVRDILGRVAELDAQAASLLNEKMRKYKEETLQIRKKKNLSSYMRAGAANQPGSPSRDGKARRSFEERSI